MAKTRNFGDVIRAKLAADPVLAEQVKAASERVLHCLVQDDDGHWYVIRNDESDAFRDWEEAAPYWEGYKGKNFNECRVDGPHRVVFSDWEETD